MKARKRIFHGFIAAVMAVAMTTGSFSQSVYALEEDTIKEIETEKGELDALSCEMEATLHFLPTLEEESAKAQEITATLYRDGVKIAAISPFDSEEALFGDYQASVSILKEGEAVEGIRILVNALPAGSYSLTFAGKGFEEIIHDMELDSSVSKKFSFDTKAVVIESKLQEQEKAQELSKPMHAEPITFNVPTTGSISAMLRFDYPQKFTTVQKQNIVATLFKGNTELLQMPLSETSYIGKKNGYTVSVVAKDGEGTAFDMLPNPETIYYYDVSFSDLPQGEYHVAFSGNGYKSYESPIIEIDDYSKKLVIGTKDRTFTIGDANADGTVNQKDVALVSDFLGSSQEDALSKYDFNRDGVINIIDIAYVNRQINASGNEALYETSFILLDNITISPDAENPIIFQGDPANMLKDTIEAVTVKPEHKGESISIPIVFTDPIEMSQVDILSPSGYGAVKQGIAIIETEDGTKTSYPFGEKDFAQARSSENTTMEAIHATGSEAGVSMISINLGKRVAVKKISIQVTRVENQITGEVEYAVIQQIKFLKDIVPENTVPTNTTVRNLKAQAGNESVMLTWSALPNVTGYTVKYGTSEKTYTETIQVATNQAEIKGLKNMTPYYFIVIPVNGDWKGNASAEVSATPQSEIAPLAPNMLQVQALDGGLLISWNKAENATYYKVYIRENVEGQEYTLVDGSIQNGKITSTNKTISGLKNGKEYKLHVLAGNDTGESKPSLETTGIPTLFTVEKPTGIPEGNISYDNIESVSMVNPNNVDLSVYPTPPGFNINYVCDDNYSSHWTSRVFWESHGINFKFKEAKDMNYMVYVPRLDSNFRLSLSRYTIKVKEPGEKEFKTIASGKVRGETKKGFVILPFPKTNVAELQVDVTQWNASPTNISLAEALFYEYNPDTDINGAVEALFADGSFTTLNSNVTAETITALSDKLSQFGDYMLDKDILADELSLAKNLLEEKPALGVVHEGIASISTRDFGGSALQPLAVAAKSGENIVVYANIPEGETVSVIATQYFAEAASWQKQVVDKLENGRNVITIPQLNQLNTPHGGSLYFNYSGNDGENIKLQIRGRANQLGNGATVAYIPVLELFDWDTMSEEERKSAIGNYVAKMKTFKQTGAENILNCTEISMPNVLLSIPADAVKAAIGTDETVAVSKIYNNVLAWEEFMKIVKISHGAIDPDNLPSGGRQNIRYMRMFAKAFMYAAGSHVGIGYGSCGGTMKGVPTSVTGNTSSNELFGWGLGHEVGHNMDILGKAEITNNIYSLMIQTYDGYDNTLPSRLETSNTYEEIRNKTAIGASGAANNVFVQLGMYWQLHLAYDDDANDSMDFYNRFFQNWNNERDYTDYNDRLAYVASITADKDLTEFFTRWGAELSQSVKNAIAAKNLVKEDRAIWYMNDESRRYRISKGSAATIPDVLLEATLGNDPNNVDNNKIVNLKFNAGANGNSQLLGYEIRRNGQPIAFTTETSYSDKIGTANNLSFRYTVVAVDLLGNISKASNECEVRISYASTIDESAYTMKAESNGISFTMNGDAPVAVSGILLSPAPTASDYTVEITTADGATVTAKTGNFASDDTAGAYLSYFNKPKAQSDDTRMWTYDAKTVKIVGNIGNSTVKLISYPGDNVAFYPEAMVGRLANDYKYGDGAEDVIKANTLVVLGTYRGDPVYNFVQITGQFVETVQSAEGEEKQKVTERPLAGDSYLFAEIPTDGAVSDISDGFFLFVPDVQAEKELQNPESGDIHSSCDTDSVLPSRIKAELYRTNQPGSAEGKRLTSDTIWISSPQDEDMPSIKLN